MIQSTSDISTTSNAYSINLLTFNSSKSFDEVASAFEKQLGRLDQEQALSAPGDFAERVQRMEGSSGLMIIAILEMDRLVPSLTASATHARQYLVGNPLIASQMAKLDTLAALYAPPRVLIYTRDEKTWIAYDQPSTTFGRLASDDILRTAKELDKKFENLVRQALA
jgi:uncharacterized protein (DUF302 family)